MQEDFNIQEYLARSVENIVKDSIKAKSMSEIDSVEFCDSGFMGNWMIVLFIESLLNLLP